MAKKERPPRPLIEPTGDDWRRPDNRSLAKINRDRTSNGLRPATQYGAKKSEAVMVKFLSILAMGGSPTKAALEVGISRATAFNWKREDEEFAARWTDAVEQGTDMLEDEMHRRAHVGVEKPVLFQGDVVALVREPSDALMQFALKARRKNKYGDKVAVTGGGPDDEPMKVMVLHRIIVDPKKIE